MNWNQNLRAIAELAGDSALFSNSDFQAIMPDCVASAENRILRDLDLLSTRVQDDTGRMTQNRKVFILPDDVGTFIVVEQIRVIIPSYPGAPGIYGPPLLPMTKDAIDMLFPSELAPSQPSVPEYWAPLDQATVAIAPPPDQDYYASVFGTQRPAPLSPKSGDTFISTQLRDLFLFAEMIFISAQQRNWSAQSDDPQMSVSYVGQYEALKSPALIEETRKKLMASGWSSRLPSPVANSTTNINGSGSY